MLTKLIIFGLLCCTIIQAFPTTDNEIEEDEEEPCPLPQPESYSKPDSTSVNGKLLCADQIGWVRDTTLAAKEEYEKYYKRFAESNIDVKNLSIVKVEHEEIEKQIADTLKRCDVDLKKVHANVKDEWNICIDELRGFSIMNQNLSALTQSIRPKIIDFAKKLGLPPDTIDDLDHTLGRIVNFMFIIDMGKNTFRDIHSMINEAWVKTENGVKLEEKYKFTEEGVEAIGQLKEIEQIGHVEEPAIISVKETVIKPKDKPHVADRGPAYTVHDPEAAGAKDFDDLIDFNDDIVNTNKELEQREQQEAAKLAEERRLAEREHLEEKERLEEEARLQREREISERGFEYSLIRNFHG